MSTKRVLFSAIVFAVAGAVLVFVLMTFVLPDTWHVESTRDLRAPAARVAALVTDLKSWNDWSSMDASLGAQTTREVVGVAGTAGQAMRWTGSKGQATLKFTAVGPDGLEYDFRGMLADGTPYPWYSDGRIEWQQQGDVCHVTWRERGTWESLVGRWFGWFGAVQTRVRQIQSSSLEGLVEALERDAK